MRIELDQITKDTCKKFANDVVDTNIDEYQRRNQFDKDKIITDIYVGKMAEFATYQCLKAKGKHIQPPDCAIYTSYRKSFSADLQDDTYHYHVKCMTASSAERFGLSWSFQKYDKLVTQPKDKDIIVLTEFDKDVVDIKSVIRATVVTAIYKPPVLKKLQQIKCVLMWNDVYQLINSTRL